MSEDDVPAGQRNGWPNPPDIDVGVTPADGPVRWFARAGPARHSIPREAAPAKRGHRRPAPSRLIVIPEDLVHRPGEDQERPRLGTGEKGQPGGHAARHRRHVPADDVPRCHRRYRVDSEIGRRGQRGRGGIAGAFGLASQRASRDDAHRQPDRTGPVRRPVCRGNPAVLEPATPSFWGERLRAHPAQLKSDRSRFEAAPEGGRRPLAASNAAIVVGGPQPRVDAIAVGRKLVSSRGRQPVPTSARPEVDAPTERLPIYEAVLSQWFPRRRGHTAPARPRYAG